ncbi:MAG: glycogen/starch/alpha-glucan phosphorylase [Gammaproteobacteria bacterium]|jgi:starch phosphorylase|nr:glycogen/starch/alpha-glucan phosphorylase [Gammaproteobacteria bacterium]
MSKQQDRARRDSDCDRLGMDADSIRCSMADLLEFRIGKDLHTATPRDWFHVLAYMVRDRMIEQWMQTTRAHYHQDAKRVYYLSMEFLIGRSLQNSLLNLGMLKEAEKALKSYGMTMDEVMELEPEAALGNGGLGRLAACFLDSMATLGIPGYGYGIRYEYGMFRQQIEDGYQVEHPDNWLRYGNPWEFPRSEVIYPIRFNGRVVDVTDERGVTSHHWVDTDEVIAMAYDTPIPGYRSGMANNMRLWTAKSSRDFDLRYFNEGNYIKAVEAEAKSENISRVLYPSDTTEMGRALRLRQQYFFVCASLQDILYRYQRFHDSLDGLPDKIAIQLNDTHPAIAIPELMRVLLDVHGFAWERAWNIVVRVFAYTNHTLMPEALETWPIDLFEEILPRHLQIIYEINHRFLKDAMHRWPGDPALLRRMSIIREDGNRAVRMAHLAIIGSHRVNGVAQLHTDLMKSTIFADFYRFCPEKFLCVTNGVTPRRWLHHINPGLSRLIGERIGNGWTVDLDQLERLAPYAEDAEFRSRSREVKRHNKELLAGLVQERLGIELRVDSLFDVHIKRIHEYKRQLLNVLHIITCYNRIREGSAEAPLVPRTCIFAGKAAPGYMMAKLVIKLINDVAEVINNDPAVNSWLRVAFIPNYDVSTASDIIPAADLSEQISTAGMEASGTGNMKLALNGALTIGTLDGANIEIRDAVGHDNIFIFGHTAEEVGAMRPAYSPRRYYESNSELRQAIDMISQGFFVPEDTQLYRPLCDSLLSEDRYMVLADYASYMECQRRAESLYQDADAWSRAAVLNIAHMGRFSSDRAVREYARNIWGVPVGSATGSGGQAVAADRQRPEA